MTAQEIKEGSVDIIYDKEKAKAIIRKNLKYGEELVLIEILDRFNLGLKAAGQALDELVAEEVLYEK